MRVGPQSSDKISGFVLLFSKKTFCLQDCYLLWYFPKGKIQQNIFFYCLKLLSLAITHKFSVDFSIRLLRCFNSPSFIFLHCKKTISTNQFPFREEKSQQKLPFFISWFFTPVNYLKIKIAVQCFTFYLIFFSTTLFSKKKRIFYQHTNWKNKNKSFSYFRLQTFLK